MTAVGVATLFITQDYAARRPRRSTARNVAAAPAIEKGIEWMAENFDQGRDRARSTTATTPSPRSTPSSASASPAG